MRTSIQDQMNEKRELARRLVFGDGVDKNEEKGVSLLEDCVTHGDADAMLMLAKCYALGLGTKHNAERAEELLSDSARKGSKDASDFANFIGTWRRYIIPECAACLSTSELH